MGIFVHRPGLYFAIAGFFVILLLLARFTGLGTERSPRALWTAFAAWALAGLWEYAVMTRSPEANIRVDLLVLLPALGILSAWALFRLFR